MKFLYLLQTYSKRVGTPKRWWPKGTPVPKASSRSFATQTDDVIIVEKECHCQRPSLTLPPDTDDDISITSETTEMDFAVDADDPDFDPAMENADSDIRYYKTLVLVCK
ncbi:MAG: hypothetical protein ABW185_23045 [Sedimenticola sp.]